MCIASRPACSATAGALSAPKALQTPEVDPAAYAAELVGRVLEQAVVATHRAANGDVPLQGVAYEAESVPPVPLTQYLQRWVRYTGCSAGTVVCAAIYVDRVVLATKIPLTALVIHRLLLAALLVATKWSQDRVCTNTIFAGIGGVTRDELNRLEVAFLGDLEWNTFVDASLYQTYLSRLYAMAGRC